MANAPRRQRWNYVSVRIKAGDCYLTWSYSTCATVQADTKSDTQQDFEFMEQYGNLDLKGPSEVILCNPLLKLSLHRSSCSKKSFVES